MKCAGKSLQLCLLLLCTVTMPLVARGAIFTEVDRTEVALGETLRLTIRADAGEQPNELDLSGIERDFEILQRSSSTSARLVGGEQSVTRTLELDLSPRRDGVMTIPSLTAGGRRTTPIAIKVSPQPEVIAGDELVAFDTKVDQTDVYVQAQLILTVTLQQAINLDNRTITELDIPDVYVEPLEQKSFQRRISGRLWQVTELRYALFPQKSEDFEIPALAFSGRELLPGRSLLGARLGRRITLESEPIKIEVKAVPASFPGETWLPASRLELTSQWSAPPAALVTGDSTTRTIEIVAEGLQGSQLPPITSLGGSSGLDGLRFYPDKETIDQREVQSGLEGYRLQSEALVASRAGDWELPPLSIPWWNTETDSLEYAKLPREEILVEGASVVEALGTGSTDAETVERPQVQSLGTRLWQGAAVIGWLLTAVFAGLWLWQRQTTKEPVTPNQGSRRDGVKPLVSLRLACSSNNPEAARAAVIEWGKLRLSPGATVTLQEIRAVVGEALSAELKTLDEALYQRSGGMWNGDRLFALIQSEDSAPEQPETGKMPALYPTG